MPQEDSIPRKGGQYWTRKGVAIGRDLTLEALLTRQAELERMLDLNKSEQQVVEDQDQKDGAGVRMDQTNGQIPPGDLGATGGAGTEQYDKPRARGNRSPASCEPQP